METQTDKLKEILHALLKHWQAFCRSLFWRENVLKETAWMPEYLEALNKEKHFLVGTILAHE